MLTPVLRLMIFWYLGVNSDFKAVYHLWWWASLWLKWQWCLKPALYEDAQILILIKNFSLHLLPDEKCFMISTFLEVVEQNGWNCLVSKGKCCWPKCLAMAFIFFLHASLFYTCIHMYLCINVCTFVFVSIST